MPTTEYKFETPTNYAKVNTEIVGGFGQLALVPDAQPDFEQLFLDAAGFTFDAAKLAVNYNLLGAQTFIADFETDEDGNVGVGDLTGTLFGGAAVVAGVLELNAGDYATYKKRWKNKRIKRIGAI